MLSLKSMLRRAVSRPARPLAARAARRLPLFAAPALLLASPAALAALSVDVTRLGLFGDAFPGADPELSATYLTDPRGQSAGFSERPGVTVDSRNFAEIAAWYHVGNTTTRVGLYSGPDFTLSPDATGYRGTFSRYSVVLGFGQGEGSFGTSDRYSPVWLYAGTHPPDGYSRQYDRGYSGWIYFGGVTTEVGLTDAEHTAFDGARFSTPTALNAAGQAIGTSSLSPNPNIHQRSSSTWFFNGSTTARTGLVGGEHTAGDNYHWSANTALNARGDVVGHTQRYGSTVDVRLGQSAWIHRDGQNIDLSLTGFEHEKTTFDGATERTYRFSTIAALNDAGHVVGTAQRFSATGADAGQSVWRFGTTTRDSTADISPAGPGFTRDDGYRFAAPSWLSDNGEVVGIASRYLGLADGGRSAWLYSFENGTRDISPTDGGFVRADGYRFATPLARTDLGHIIGSATRYSGASENGQAVWSFNGGTTLDIGLDTPEVVGPGGARTDTFVNTMPGGKVLGYSARTDGGREAWLHTPGASARDSNTQAIGLSGAGRTQTIVAHTPTNQVVGHADRPDGGREAWRYNGSVTTDIGMAGANFQTAAGLRHSTVQFVNTVGDAVGRSRTYDGIGDQAGEGLWFNDGASTRLMVEGAIPGAGGYSYTATHLTNSGLAVGYQIYNSLTGAFYQNAFVWDSRAPAGEEMNYINIGRLPRSTQVGNDVRFVSDRHAMVIGEYRDYSVPFRPNGFYVWARGQGTFDLDSLVSAQLFNETGISSLSYFTGEFTGSYSFLETDEGVVMTIENDDRAGGLRTYQLLINPTAIPEPASFGMLAGAAALGLAALRRRRRAAPPAV